VNIGIYSCYLLPVRTPLNSEIIRRSRCDERTENGQIRYKDASRNPELDEFCSVATLPARLTSE
jgi:hypothetical protein